MGYRIDYQGGNKKKYLTVKQKRVPKWVLGICCVLAALAVFGGSIRDFLLPGDPEVTGAAVTSLLSNLQEGKSVHSALHTFCEDILQGANIYE